MHTPRILCLICLAAVLRVPLQAEDLWRIEGVDARLVQAVLSADGATLALRTADGRIVVRDLDGAREPFAFSNRPYPVTALSLSADGAQAAWGDTRGNLYRWSAAAGLRQTARGTAGLTAVGQTADGAEIIAASDGTALAYLRASDFGVIRNQSVTSEQIHALALDPAAATVFTGDHAGRVLRTARSGASYSTSARQVSNAGITGLLLVSGDDGPLLCWDQDGLLRLLSPDNLAETARIDIGPVPVRAAAFDAGTGTLHLGLAGGALLGVDLATRAVSTARQFDGAVVGLHALGDGTLLALTETGALHALGGPEPGLLEDPPLRGRAAASGLSIRSGIGMLATDVAAYRLQLAGGQAVPMDGAGEQPLASAVLRGAEGPVLIRLTFDGDRLLLQAEPESAFAPLPVTGWTPVHIAAALGSPRLALTSGDGALRILALADRELLVEREIPADPDALWTGVRFIDRDQALLQTGPRAARLIRPGDGSVERFTLPATARLDCAGFSGPANLLVFADVERLYTLAPGAAAPVLRHTAAGAQPILAIDLPPDRPEARVWTATRLVRLALPDATVLATQTHPAPLAGVSVAPDGPFALTLDTSGSLALTRIAGDPLVTAFPQLRPALAGGMATPAFGRLHASHGAWLDHEPFGWGHVRGGPEAAWFWFVTEGWLAGGEDLYPYLYSTRATDWIFTLMPDHPHPWVYDYGIHDWRAFGQ